MVKKSVLSYIAGIMDGEGYIRIAKLTRPKNSIYQVYLGVNMTDPRAIKVIQSIFGGSIYTGKRTSPNHRTLYGWIVTSQKAVSFLKAIRPYLVIKGEEADVAFTLQAHIDETPRTWHSKKTLPKSVFAYRERLFQKIARLKHVRHKL